MLVRKVGEMIIPYDVKKISEVTRFKYDTVIVAMGLYKKIGLIFEESDGVFTITNFDSMVGSETKWAEKKRLQRDKSKDKVPKLPPKKDNIDKDSKKDKEGDKVPDLSDTVDGTLSDKRLEIRDKSIDNRERVVEIDDSTTTTTTDADMSAVMQTYSDNIHPVTGKIEADRLVEILTRFGKTWVIAAIDRAVVRNKRSLGYIEGILKGWGTNGFDNGEASKHGQRSSGNHKPNYTKGQKSETDWSKEQSGW
jgi:DnaD/phage-associated family protein